MKQNEAENKKKSQSIFGWLLWWQLDKDELQRQVKEYETLKIYQSARGISLLFLLFSAVATTGFILFLNLDSSNFLDIFLFLILGFFIYKGHRWAMIGAMLLWTFEKLYMFIEQSSTIIGNPSFTRIFLPLLWWATYMHAFYFAFKVEGLRAKAKKELVNANKEIIKGRSFDELERLAELKNKGVITEEDFNKKKREILGL